LKGEKLILMKSKMLQNVILLACKIAFLSTNVKETNAAEFGKGLLIYLVKAALGLCELILGSKPL
jgi:hypothetical protein